MASSIHEIGSRMCRKLITLVFLIFSIRAEPRVVAISIPKAGSFLLYKCIQLITSKEPEHAFHAGNFSHWDGAFVTNHELPTPQAIEQYRQKNIKGVFIYRDPRDQIVSTAYFFKEKLKNPKAVSMLMPDLIFDCMYNSCLWWQYVVFVSANLPHDVSIVSLYNQMLDWRKCNFIYSTSFEKLVGPQGGGTRDEQIQEIINIAEHIGSPLSEQRACDIADQLFGRFETFRQGKIGAWKKDFTQEHKDAFKLLGGDLLIKLGYEKDLNW